MCRMAFLLLVISATLSTIPGITLSAEPVDDFVSQLQHANFQVARLESILEENNQKLNERSLYLKECERRIDEMSEKIHNLHSTLSSIKVGLLAVLNNCIFMLSKRSKFFSAFDHPKPFNHFLSELAHDQADAFHAEKRIKALEDEVQLLWATSRKNNFDLHVLECKAQDAEKRLQEVTSVVEKEILLHDEEVNDLPPVRPLNIEICSAVPQTVVNSN